MQGKMPDLDLVCRRRFVQSLKYMLKTWQRVEGEFGRQEPKQPVATLFLRIDIKCEYSGVRESSPKPQPVNPLLPPE